MRGRLIAATRGHRPVVALAVLLLVAAGRPVPAVATPPVAGSPPGPFAGSATTWPDDRFHRVAALALIEQLRASLLSETSATLTLERWCRMHRIAAGVDGRDPQVVAVPDPGRIAPPDDAQRALLAVGPDETVRYRHVRLVCGGTVLSDAENWYVPSRLTPEMNRRLDTTHIPFGKAIAALGFTRTTLSSELSWSPLPAGWSGTGTGTRPGPSATPARALEIPDTVILNRALLHDHAGQPLALLVERYQSGILAFPPPAP